MQYDLKEIAEKQNEICYKKAKIQKHKGNIDEIVDDGQ